MSKRCIDRVGGFTAIFVIGIAISSYRTGTNTGSTSKRPRYRGSSLYSIDGCTKGAMSAWSFAVSSFEKTRTALPARSMSFGVIPHVSRRYSTSLVRVVGCMACTQMSDRPLPSRVRSWRPFARSANVPSSMYQIARESGVNCLR